MDSKKLPAKDRQFLGSISKTMDQVSQNTVSNMRIIIIFDCWWLFKLNGMHLIERGTKKEELEAISAELLQILNKRDPLPLSKLRIPRLPPIKPAKTTTPSPAVTQVATPSMPQPATLESETVVPTTDPQLQLDNQRLQADISTKNNTIETLSTTISEQSATISEQSATIGSQTATIDSQTATIGAQATAINTHLATINEQSATIDSQNATIGAQATAINTHIATINTQNQQLEANARLITELTARAKVASKQVQDMAKIVGDLMKQ